MKQYRIIGRLIALGVVLSMSGGCEFFNRSTSEAPAADSITTDDVPMTPEEVTASDPNDPVILKIEGKAVGRKEEFLQFASDFIKATPLAQFGLSTYESAPAPIQEQLFNAFLEQKLISRWGYDQGLQHDQEFKDTLEKLLERIKQELMAKTFEKRIFDGIQVNDKDIQETYTKNRERFIKEPGSMTVRGAGFDADEKASVFQHLMSEQGGDAFQKLAEESSGEFKDFGNVSTDPRMAFTSPLPPALRAMVFSMPAGQEYGRAVDNNVHWVVQIVSRNEPVYSPFEEVREQVTMGARTEKFMKEREGELKKLRDRYTVDSDTSMLVSASAAAPANPFAALMGGMPTGAAPTEEAAEEAPAEEAGDEEGVSPEQLQAQLAQLLGQMQEAGGDEGEGATDDNESADEGDAEDIDLEALLKQLGIDPDAPDAPSEGN